MNIKDKDIIQYWNHRGYKTEFKNRLNLSIENFIQNRIRNGNPRLHLDISDKDLSTFIKEYFTNNDEWKLMCAIWAKNNFNKLYRPRIEYTGCKIDITLSDLFVANFYYNGRKGNYRLVYTDNEIDYTRSKKWCNSCCKRKYFTEFSHHNGRKYNITSFCTHCKEVRNRVMEVSLLGRLKKIYDGQVYNSKKREHPRPAYTKTDLVNMFKDDPLYIKLHQEWVDSDCNMWKAPSIDRIDSTKPYTEDNIQLMTWKENADKGNIENGKPVLKVDFNGNILEEYPTLLTASQKLGISRDKVYRLCKGKVYKDIPYLLKYKEDYSNK